VIHASTLEYSNLSNPITLRLILGEGLGRLMKMRKVVPLEKKKDGRFGDDQHRSEILDLLEERIICLGTYEWLCRHLCVGFQSTVFFSQFIKANKLVIAKRENPFKDIKKHVRRRLIKGTNMVEELIRHHRTIQNLPT